MYYLCSKLRTPYPNYRAEITVVMGALDQTELSHITQNSALLRFKVRNRAEFYQTASGLPKLSQIINSDFYHMCIFSIAYRLRSAAYIQTSSCPHPFYSTSVSCSRLRAPLCKGCIAVGGSVALRIWRAPCGLSWRPNGRLRGCFAFISNNPSAPSGHLPLHKGGFCSVIGSGYTKRNWDLFYRYYSIILLPLQRLRGKIS